MYVLLCPGDILLACLFPFFAFSFLTLPFLVEINFFFWNAGFFFINFSVSRVLSVRFHFNFNFMISLELG